MRIKNEVREEYIKVMLEVGETSYNKEITEQSLNKHKESLNLLNESLSKLFKKASDLKVEFENSPDEYSKNPAEEYFAKQESKVYPKEEGRA